MYIQIILLPNIGITNVRSEVIQVWLKIQVM
jgi:hypothetical protein